jgi:tetratricopeptide (TPR) repeat protein
LFIKETDQSRGVAMNHSNFIDNIFNVTRKVPSTDALSDTFIKEKRLIKPEMPAVPYGCPSLFDLKHHLFVIKDESIAQHIQSCWLCQNIAKRYQTKRFLLEKMQLLFESYVEMFRGHKGWTHQVIAHSYAFLLFVICFLGVVLIQPSKDSHTEYQTASIFSMSLKSFNQFIKPNSHDQLIDYAKQIELVNIKVGNQTLSLPVIADKDQIQQSMNMPIDPSIQKEDILNTIDLWRNVLIFYSDALLKAGKIEVVIQFLSEARRNNPKDKCILFGLGELYKMSAYSYTGDEFRKRHQKAIQLYEYMIENHMADDDPRPYHYAGWSYYECKNIIKAVLYYKKAIEIDPNYAKVHFNMAMLYKEHSLLFGKNALKLYDASFKAAKDAIQYFINKEGVRNPRIPYTLAIFCAVENKWDNCLSWLEESLKSDPWYCFRAQHEKWFVPLKQLPTYSNRFNTLLETYYPKQPKSFISIEQKNYLFDVMFE